MSEPLLTLPSGVLRINATTAVTYPAVELSAGEIIVLAGRNGSGKSSLLKHWFLTSHRQVTWGWIQHKRDAYADLWVRDVLDLGLTARRAEGASRPTVDKMDQVLQKFDLTDLALRPIHLLSDGEWLRVQLARVYGQDPAVLGLDEPTAHLDFYYAAWWKEWCKERQQEGKGLIVVSHDLEWIKAQATRVGWIEGGVMRWEKPQEFAFR
jgi:ABC-type cobalamin/Fe3+-siderophores transport system ATPase subunit